VLPVNVHQFGEFAQIAGQQSVAAFVSQLLGEMQVIEHLAGIVASSSVLIAQNFRRGARGSGEEEQQAVLEIRQSFRGDLQRLGNNLTIRQKFETGNAAEGRDVLILLADRFFQQIDFDVTSLLRQFLGWNEVSLHSVQGAQKRRGEAARGA